MLRPTALIAPALLLFTAACGARGAVIVDDRETYIETIADTVCNEKEECNRIGGDDAEYESMDACHDDIESFMRDFWPEDECRNDRINGDLFMDCDDRARLMACDSSLAEAIATWDECNSSEVCVD